MAENDMQFCVCRGYLDVDMRLLGADGLLPSTYLSVKADWSFGLAYINGFNLVRRQGVQMCWHAALLGVLGFIF